MRTVYFIDMQTSDTCIQHSIRIKFAMKKEDSHFQESGIKFAAVCGLYCEACRWFIFTNEDQDSQIDEDYQQELLKKAQ